MFEAFPWLAEFLILATAHFIAVASPGPDFIVVVKNTLSHGRRFGVITAIGVGLGIGVHMLYTLLGVGVLLTQSDMFYGVFKVIAAGYLLYIAYQSAKSSGHQHEKVYKVGKNYESMSETKALSQGFLTNALNPKATLFFLTLFTSIVSIHTPVAVKGFYAIYLILFTGAWFIFLAAMIGHPFVRTFLHQNVWIDRLMAVILVGLAGNLLLTVV